MQTLRIPYEIAECNELTVYEYRRQFSNCLRSAFNRLSEGMQSSDVYHYVKNLDGVELINSTMIKSVICEARRLLIRYRALNEVEERKFKALKDVVSKISKNPKLRTRRERNLVRRFTRMKRNSRKFIFGGRRLLQKLQEGKITKEQFNERRLCCFSSVGEACNHGNLIFRISNFKSAVIFRPSKNVNPIPFHFKGLSKQQKILIDLLYEQQEISGIPITYKFDGEYIYIIFDEKLLYGITRDDKIENRVIAIDQNPNYIGWSVVDWSDGKYEIIKSGVFNFKHINDSALLAKGDEKTYFAKKRRYEHYQIVKSLARIGFHFKCSLFAVEDLNFSTSIGVNNSTSLNKLIYRMWNRTRFIENLRKKCNALDFKLIEVPSQFSSKFGNVLYRKHGLPDMVNASIEIGRRAYEFNRQYIEKTKEISKTIIHPNLTQFDDVIAKSKEEFGITEDCADLYELFGVLAKQKKNAEVLYRVPLNVKNIRWFKSQSRKSKVLTYVFQ